MRFLFPLLFILPFIELALLMKVGQAIGVLNTIGIVLLTAVLGLNLLRQQGISVLLKASQKMQQGSLPAEEMAEGILIAAGGVFLLLPGLITDVAGLLCMIPFTRQLLARHIVKRGIFVQGATFQTHFTPPSGDDVIEGQFTRDDLKKLK